MAKKKVDPPPVVETVSTPPVEVEEKIDLEELREQSRIDLFRMQLTQPFPVEQVKIKPQSVKGNRAMAIAYIDARLVMDRLDEVVGPGGWADKYEVLPDGSVICTLEVMCPVRFGNAKSVKSDVGSLSEQPDAGDRLKAAFSDALKRAAVKYGIGRYLYRLPLTWMDYDPVKKRIVGKYPFPDWAIPKKQPYQTHAYHEEGEIVEPDEPTHYKAPSVPEKTQTAASGATTPTKADGPKDAKPGAKEKKPTTLAEFIKDWDNKLASCTTPDDLNAMLPGVKAIPTPELRLKVWEHILRCAGGVGWHWDQPELKFEKSGEGIPF